MTTLLFVMAALTGPQQGREPGREPGRPIIDERPHTVGIGSALTASNHGIGGATRFFFNDRIGVDFEANWYKPQTPNTTGSTFQVTPSFLFMLSRPNDLRDVDIRPYVGGGLSYVNSTYRSTRVQQPLDQRTSGVGGQAFAGAEITFRAAQWVTISFEGRYYNLPVTFVNSNMIGGMNYLMLFHFFVN